MSTPTVVVIGAGITGLTSARALSAAGARVTVLEAQTRLGGQIHTRTLHGLPLDVGAEAMHVSGPNVTSFLSEVGLAETVVTAHKGTSWLWTRRGLRPLPAGVGPAGPSRLRPVLRARLMDPVGLVRAGLEPALAGRVRLEDDADLSVGEFVRARFGAQVSERIVDPLLGSLHSGHIHSLSMRACAPSLVPAAMHGRSLLRKRRPPARPSGSPGGRGAPVSMMSFISWGQGLSTVIDAVAEGLTVRTGCRVKAVRRGRHEDAPYRIDLQDGSTLAADAVVAAVPARVAARLLDPLVETFPLASQTYATVATMVAAFPRTALEATPAFDGANGVLVPSSARSVMKAATFLTRKWPHLDAAPEGIVRMSVGRAGDNAVASRDDETLMQAALADLRSFTGLAVPPAWWHVERWENAMPQLTVGHLDRLGQVRAQLPAGVVVAGASYDGIGIGSCLTSARQAATHLTEHLGLSQDAAAGAPSDAR